MAAMALNPTRGRLVLAGVPLGNLDDASPRLRDAITDADIIAAEDTRRLQRLARSLGVNIPGRVFSFFEGNEAGRVPQLVHELRQGQQVLLVTDAGMPSISDPGYRLVTAAIDAGVPITCIPGPSAVTTALALSGLPVDRFCFEGFLPRRAGERTKRLESLRTERRTMVFFEAPHRLAETLRALAEVFGGARAAAVCRELTKTYEEVRRGGLAELVAWADDGVKGEITLVVEGATPLEAGEYDAATLAEFVEVAELAGMSRKEAVATVGKTTGVGRRAVFDALISRKHSE
jgi:16S rRNA (cytidine1402-2'-O)-methyltransferase